MGDVNIINSIKELIGNTPMIRLKNIESFFNIKSKLYAKLEFFNPSGSIKDRAALEIIEDMISKKMINQNTKIIEPTSGNMGISLAMLSNCYNYDFTCVMPKNMSKERISLVKSYNGKVILTDKKEKMLGSIKKTNEIINSNSNYISVKQFENINNMKAHYKTALEIINQVPSINIFLTGIGTGGTITGISIILKRLNNKIKIVGVEPKTTNHNIQGIGANFTPPLLKYSKIDYKIKISDEEAYEMQKKILELEGINVGISSGANLAAMLNLSKSLNEELKIVTVFPDRGERYLTVLLGEQN